MNAATLAKKLDSSKLTGFHRRLIGVSGFGWMFDSMDVGIISFVVASLVKEWGLSSDQQGLIISMGMLGMFVGASLSGVLADRYGRKTIFQATLLVYSIATGLSALVGNLSALLGLRFLVGLGLGGELPVASTLVSEMAPAKERGRLLVLLESFWALGWIAAAVIAYFVIPVWGWRIAFAIGAVPALYVFVLRRGIPESPRFLLSKGRKAEAAAVAASITGDQGFAAEAMLGESETKNTPSLSIKGALAGLWTRPYLKRTAMLWMLWFGIVYSYYGIFTWLPSILARDHTLIKSFEYVLIITLAQIPGYFSAAYLVEKLGRRWTLGLYLLGSAVSAYFFGQGGSDTTILIWGCLLSFFNLGAWGVVYTYTPELYPTRMRGTGAGLAAACGRVGGIIGPYLVGWLLGPANMGVTFVFGMFAVVLLLIAVNVFVLGEETKGRTLEEIAQ